MLTATKAVSKPECKSRAKLTSVCQSQSTHRSPARLSLGTGHVEEAGFELFALNAKFSEGLADFAFGLPPPERFPSQQTGDNRRDSPNSDGGPRHGNALRLTEQRDFISFNRNFSEAVAEISSPEIFPENRLSF